MFTSTQHSRESCAWAVMGWIGTICKS